MDGKLALVVDDEPSIRRVLRFWLRDCGFEVAEAATAEDGLAYLAGNHPDLLITDVRLPGLSGAELARRAIRVMDPSRVFLVSAGPCPEDLPAAVRFLSKPDGLEHLFDLIAGHPLAPAA